MVDEDEYELFPHKLLEDLRDDVEALKKKLSEPETATQELIAEIEDLKTTLRELHNLFKEALKEIKEEDPVKLMLVLQNKLEKVATQNETIARGLVAIADKLDDFMKKQQVLRPTSIAGSTSSLPSPQLGKVSPPPPFPPTQISSEGRSSSSLPPPLPPSSPSLHPPSPSSPSLPSSPSSSPSSPSPPPPPPPPPPPGLKKKGSFK